MTTKLIIFDFDGTLADSYPWFLTIFQDLARRYRLPEMGPEDLDRLRALDIRQILAEYRVPFWKLILIGSHLKRLMSSQIDQIRLVNGMQPVLAALHSQGVRLAVVTSNAEKNVRRVLGPENMAYFPIIESGVSMFGKKRSFEKVLKRSGVQAHEALCVGDELRDLKSAREARIPFAAVAWGYTAACTLHAHAPDALFEHPAQILTAVSPPRADASPPLAVPPSAAG